MKRIHKFLRLSLPEQRLLVKSFFILAGVGAGLKLLPFNTVRRLLMRLTPAVEATTSADAKLILRVSWAIETVSNYLPSMTCLPKALTTHLLLSRVGQPAALRIGVAKSLEGQFQAHAWVESNGCIVMGKVANLHRFAVLPPLEK